MPGGRIVLAGERRQKVLELVKKRGFVALTDLASQLSFSESTIRRDLDYWDQHGVLKRTHGGAMFTGEQLGSMPALDERLTTALAEKQAVARAAALRIEEGFAVLLDGGTTTLEVAKLLVGRRLQVVTNSLPIATLLAASREIDLIMLGGYVYPKTGVALGPLTVAMLERIHVQQAIMGVSGVTPQGLYNSNLLLVETERAMMRSADEVVVAADHTKLDRPALSLLCPLSTIDTLIVDAGLSKEQRRWITEAGTRLIVAGEATETGDAEGFHP
jgi:DeoR/GlpR family transcriptional regulator of sugar metabolism